MRRKKSRGLSFLMAGILAVGAVAGIGTAVRVTTSSSTVPVVQASELNYNWGMYDSTSLSGTVTNEASQQVYVSDTQTVDQVLVKQGQKVKEGQVLLTYDMEKTGIALKQEQLNHDRIQLNLDIALQNLSTLNQLQPVSDSQDSSDDGGWTDWDFDEDTDWDDPDEEPEEEDLYPDAAVYSRLFYEEEDPEELNPVPYNQEEENVGTKDNPFRYLCEDPVRVEKEFIEHLLEEYEEEEYGDIYVQLEYHQDNRVSGTLLGYWKKSLKDLEKMEFPLKVVFTPHVVPVTPEPEPEPTAEPTPEPTEEPDPVTPVPSPGDREEQEEDTSSGNTEADGTAASFRQIRGEASVSPLKLSGTAESQAVLTSDETEVYAGTSDGRLIASNAQMTKEEIAAAIKENENDRKSLILDLQESELKLDQAGKALEEGSVTAKFDGVVKKVSEPSSPPADGSAFLELSGDNGVYIQTAVSETMLGKLKTGSMLTVQAWESGTWCTAVVKNISEYPDTSGSYSSWDSNDSYYPVTAAVEEDGETLRTGEYVDLSLQLTEEDMEAVSGGSDLYLYKAFILDENGQKVVYKRGEDGKLKRQVVQTGAVSGSGVLIEAGLTEEDWIAFPYGSGIKEGAKTRESTMEQLYQQS